MISISFISTLFVFSSHLTKSSNPVTTSPYRDFTQPKHNSKEEVRASFQERQERLQNCSHEWDPRELRRIMVLYEQMDE